MDHIQKIGTPYRQEGYPIVPLLCDLRSCPTTPLGPEQFSMFSKNFGNKGNEISRGDLEDLGPNGAIAKLQQWLYFGVMVETFASVAIPFHKEDFVTKAADGKAIITTEELPRYLWYLLANLHHSDRHFKHRHRLSMISILNLTNTILSRVVTLLRGWPVSPAGKVLLSISVLGETISNAYDQMTGREKSFSTMIWVFPPLKDALLRAGWCIREIEQLLRTTNSLCLLYLSTIDRQALQKDHSKCDQFKRCQAYQVVHHKYKTKHASHCADESTCESVGPAVDELTGIIKEGRIPLVGFDYLATPPVLHVLRFEEESEFYNEYVAISHVWSDGMGNPLCNTLPICQLRRIQELVNHLYINEPTFPEKFLVPFWIDTLCVPLDPLVKPLALNLMANTYKFADKTLVLDQSLQSVGKAASLEECWTRIKLAPWMTRLWTFQEGRLSKDLHFQFLDKTVRIPAWNALPALRPNPIAVSALLQRRGVKRSLAEKSGMLLARALAFPKDRTLRSIQTEASAPATDDPRQEYIRLSSIELLRTRKDEFTLSELWMPEILAVDPAVKLSEEDSELQRNLSSIVLDPTRPYGQGAMNSIHGLSSNARRDEWMTFFGNTKPSPYWIFNDVMWTIYGRTTSRLEDETICLSVFMGLDVSKVQEVPVLHWKVKEALTCVLAHIPTDATLQKRITWMLRSSQEERIKMFLSQLESFSRQLLFWDTPRLQSSGWRWAPLSFLELSLQKKGLLLGKSEQCARKREGLEAECIAFRIDKANFPKSQALHEVGPILSLHSAGSFGFGYFNPYHDQSKWQYMRLRLSSSHLQPSGTWKQLIESGNAAIVTPTHHSDKEGFEVGILTVAYKMEHNVTFARHVMLVDRVLLSGASSIEDAISVYGEGYKKSRWCIG